VLARQLLDMHQHLRDELDDLRSGTRRAADLRAHCLAFCAAVHDHHTGEDASVFPWLARTYPELRPVLDVLQRDHEQVAEMLTRLRELATAPGSPAVQSELDGLAALLESHFLYEERTLLAALGSL
jgi:hemerythrin-like domain-containing protein